MLFLRTTEKGGNDMILYDVRKPGAETECAVSSKYQEFLERISLISRALGIHEGSKVQKIVRLDSMIVCDCL